MFMAALAYDSLQVVYLLSLFNPLSLCFLMFPGITLTSYKYVPDASENVFAETLKASIALIYWTYLVHITLVKNLMTFFVAAFAYDSLQVMLFVMLCQVELYTRLRRHSFFDEVVPPKMVKSCFE